MKLLRVVILEEILGYFSGMKRKFAVQKKNDETK